MVSFALAMSERFRARTAFLNFSSVLLRSRVFGRSPWSSKIECGVDGPGERLASEVVIEKGDGGMEWEAADGAYETAGDTGGSPRFLLEAVDGRELRREGGNGAT